MFPESADGSREYRPTCSGRTPVTSSEEIHPLRRGFAGVVVVLARDPGPHALTVGAVIAVTLRPGSFHRRDVVTTG